MAVINEAGGDGDCTRSTVDEEGFASSAIKMLVEEWGDVCRDCIDSIVVLDRWGGDLSNKDVAVAVGKGGVEDREWRPNKVRQPGKSMDHGTCPSGGPLLAPLPYQTELYLQWL